MKLDYLKERKEFVSVVLLGISAVLAVAILIKVASFFVAAAGAKTLVRKAIAQSELDPNDVEKYLAESKAIADELKKKNLFAPPPPKQHPVKEVSGILGNEALIKGKWYKVGDKVGDAKIVAIEPAQVRIEWEGNEKVFAPIGAVSTSGPRRDMKKGPPEKRGRRRGMERPGRVEQEEVEAPAAEEDPLAWLGVKLSAAARAKFLEGWNKMSDEQKQQAKEQWSQLSDEQKQQAADAWGQM